MYIYTIVYVFIYIDAYHKNNNAFSPVKTSEILALHLKPYFE